MHVHSGCACIQHAHVAACSHASCLFLHVWENEVKIKFTLKYPSHIFVSVFALNPLQHSVQRETPVRVRACARARAHVLWCVFVMTTRFEMGRSGKESERGRPAAAALFPPPPILPHQRAARPGGARALPTPTSPPPRLQLKQPGSGARVIQGQARGGGGDEASAWKRIRGGVGDPSPPSSRSGQNQKVQNLQ